MRFPVVLHTDNGQRYGVTVPDLPGCFSAGDSLDDALEQVRAAIDLHLEGLMDDADTELPAPRPIAEHQRNPDYANDFWAQGFANTPKERLLELMSGRHDMDKLKLLTQRELVMRYAHDLTAHVAARGDVPPAPEWYSKLRPPHPISGEGD